MTALLDLSTWLPPMLAAMVSGAGSTGVYPQKEFHLLFTPQPTVRLCDPRIWWWDAELRFVAACFLSPASHFVSIDVSLPSLLVHTSPMLPLLLCAVQSSWLPNKFCAGNLWKLLLCSVTPGRDEIQ